MSTTPDRSVLEIDAPTVSVPEQSKDRAEITSRFYEQFGRQLEPTESGRYVAITPDGRTLVQQHVLDLPAGGFEHEFGPALAEGSGRLVDQVALSAGCFDGEGFGEIHVDLTPLSKHDSAIRGCIACVHVCSGYSAAL